jgi:hypothetical protein
VQDWCHDGNMKSVIHPELAAVKELLSKRIFLGLGYGIVVINCKLSNQWV